MRERESESGRLRAEHQERRTRVDISMPSHGITIHVANHLAERFQHSLITTGWKKRLHALNESDANLPQALPARWLSRSCHP